MANFVSKSLMEEFMFFADELVSLVKDPFDIQDLKECLEHFKALRSSCDDDFSSIQSSVQDYEKKIKDCQKKTEEAKANTVADEEMEILERELEDEGEKAHLLMEEIRLVTNEINELERQRISVQERKQEMKKVEQQERWAQRKLSMYASVTDIIPNMDDQSRISGHIVDRDKRIVHEFEFDPTKISSIDICNGIWNMINSP